jgi:hypothetical protein
MTPDEELHAELWRAIAFAALSYAPISLRQVWSEIGTVPDAESLRRLRSWNNAADYRIQMESVNEQLCKHQSNWRT